MPGNLRAIADTNTPIPEGTANFDAFSEFSISTQGSAVVFAGGHTVPFNSFSGVYRKDGNGPLVRVADTSTPLPDGSGLFPRFYFFAGASPEYTVFTAVLNDLFENPSVVGLYLAPTNGPIVAIADPNTLMPGTTLGFTGASGSVIDNGRVAFVGANSEVEPIEGGVFVYDIATGAIDTIIRLHDTLPNGQPLEFFNKPSISADVVAFTGGTSDLGNDRAIYASIDGELHRIVGKGDVLEGRRVDFLGYEAEGHDGNSFAFAVLSSPTPEHPTWYTAIYVATLNLPCPPTSTPTPSSPAPISPPSSRHGSSTSPPEPSQPTSTPPAPPGPPTSPPSSARGSTPSQADADRP
ncbi:MAG: hypothetical protein H7Y88_11425 [Phycisphaerales bacterium]|nr:hypothetical protein [Phycisphaerales bacterium]